MVEVSCDTMSPSRFGWYELELEPGEDARKNKPVQQSAWLLERDCLILMTFNNNVEVDDEMV